MVLCSIWLGCLLSCELTYLMILYDHLLPPMSVFNDCRTLCQSFSGVTMMSCLLIGTGPRDRSQLSDARIIFLEHTCIDRALSSQYR